MVLPFISVIICTHNRAACLGRAIDSLLGQEYPCFEVLVVDNASADATRSVVQTRSRDDQRLTYVYEARLGLSAARNRGAALAQGELLVYLDDDAEAGDGWLAAFAMGFLNYPQAEIAGGRVSLVWPQDFEVPRWLSLNLKASLGAYDLGQEPRLIEDAKQTPRGLNYAIRKSFLEQVGGFTLHLGRIGTQLLSNEELHMTQQALEMGLGVVYLPDRDAFLFHTWVDVHVGEWIPMDPTLGNFPAGVDHLVLATGGYRDQFKLFPFIMGQGGWRISMAGDSPEL